MTTVTVYGYIADVGDIAPSSLTTKGDLLTFTTTEARLSVGANGALLTADSTEALGIKWSNAVTTKGDIFVFDGTDLVREGVAADDTILVAASGQPSGVQWQTVADVLPLTTKGDLLSDTGAGIGRLPVGSNHYVMSAASGESLGLKWDSVAFTHDLGDGSTNLLCGGRTADPYPNIEVTAEDNVVIGNNTFGAVTIAKRNVLIGNNICTTVTNTNNNVIIGDLAANVMTGTGSNVAIGQSSMLVADSASNDVCIGYRTGVSLTSGESNTFVGYLAGDTTIDGSNNVCIGRSSDTVAGNTEGGTAVGRLAVTHNYAIALGYNSSTTATHQMMIGGTSQPITEIRPAVDSTTSLGSASFRFSELFAVNGTINTSDLRLKNVQTDAPMPGINFINSLQPLQYTWKDDDKQKLHFGLGAQHVEVLIKEGVVPDFDGFVKQPHPEEPNDFQYALRLTEFIAPTIQAVKDVYNDSRELRAELQKLRDEVKELRAIVLRGQ